MLHDDYGEQNDNIWVWCGILILSLNEIYFLSTIPNIKKSFSKILVFNVVNSVLLLCTQTQHSADIYQCSSKYVLDDKI
jgi:hypothetical protein